MRRFKTQSILTRAALTLLVMMTCATAWAETQIVTYIDENGTEQTVEATLLTDGGWKDPGWYVVTGNIELDGFIAFRDSSKLILADDARLHLINYDLLCTGDLTIYGQRNCTGQFVNTPGDNTYGIRTFGNLKICGGVIEAYASKSNAAIGTANTGLSITITGGKVTATGDPEIGYGLEVLNGPLTITGGQFTATGDYGVNAKTITLGCTTQEDFIYINKTAYDNSLQIVEGQTLTDDEGNEYSGFYSGANIINGKRLHLPLPKYSITVPNFAHGSVTSDMEIASEGTTVTLTTTPDNGYELETLTVMNGDTPVETTAGANGTYTFVMPAGDVTVNAIFTSHLGEGDGSEGNPYIISSAEGWDYFCDCLQDNDTWNRFSGKTVKLGADISVSRMAGADYHDFLGNFDGGGNKLTFTAEATDSYLAPFSNVLGSSDTDHAVIRNLKVETNITANDYRHMAGLIAKVWGYVDVTNCDVTVNINSTKGDNNTDLYPAGIASQVVSSAQLAVSGCTVDGTISTNGKYAGGIIGIAQGSASITNSVSSVTIDSSTEGDGTHGGLVAVQGNYDGKTLTIEGCVFNGKLLGTSTNSCGGFVGWRNKTVNISNSLFAPAEVNIDESDCYTFSRRDGATITNSYFTDTLGVVQGKQAHSIIAGQGVTVGFSGTAAEYGTSGITAYGTGIMYKGVLYAGINDEVSLNLDGSANGYSVNAGTLTGEENPFTLLMPDENVTISAAAQFQRGDVNHDGHITIADVTALIDYLLSNDSEIPTEANVNGDSTVSIADVTALIDYLLSGAN